MTRIPLIIVMLLGLLWGQGAWAVPVAPLNSSAAAPQKRLAETCQTFESIQGDVTGNNPAASLTQNFLRAFAALQKAFNAKIADAAVGLGLILLVLFSLFYVLRMLFPFTPYGQIADTYNQIFNLWGVAIVVFLIVMNPNFIPNNVVYPIFKSLINANFSLLQVSSTLANNATEGKAKTDPSCLGNSGGSDPLERIIRGIVEQTTGQALSRFFTGFDFLFFVGLETPVAVVGVGEAEDAHADAQVVHADALGVGGLLDNAADDALQRVTAP